MRVLKRSLVIAMALAAFACVHVEQTQTAASGQPKRLAWAEGCWESADQQMSFGLLPDRARAGVHSGLILETIDGAERPSRRVMVSNDGQMLSFGAAFDEQEDAFWRSPYDDPSPVGSTMRRVHLSDGERTSLVHGPRFAAFEDAFGGRLVLVGDGDALSIFWVHASGVAGETFFAGARTACRDGRTPSDSEI